MLALLTASEALTFLAVSAAQIGVDSNFILYLVSIANGASAVGRLMSGVFALKFGALNVMIVMNFVAALMTYVWPVPSSTGGFVVVTVFYGCGAVYLPTVSLYTYDRLEFSRVHS